MVALEEYFRCRVSQDGFDLFAVFSRFEYAMKKGGFRRKDSSDAAWRTFAAHLPIKFFDEMKGASKASIYFTAPPDHLVANTNGGVDWSGNPRVPHDAASLFESIKTARNNLFHGDKTHNNHRDTELMKAALFILNAAYDAAVKEEKFHEFIDAMEYGL